VQHERVRVAPEFGDDERHALRHQASDKGNVAREPVELGDQDALALAGRCQRGGKLRAPIEGIRALAGFGFDELGNTPRPGRRTPARRRNIMPRSASAAATRLVASSSVVE
jgi:hypothetical protein